MANNNDNKSNFRKRGRLMVPAGKYVDKNGAEKTRWCELGIVFATPHHTKMCIKLNPDGHGGEAPFLPIFWDEDSKPNFIDAPVGAVDNQFQGGGQNTTAVDF